ncbi:MULTISPECIES: DUF456 domain-containing protein [unclassified Nonomuraea]|uniref:DUF456 domain-containing protein n=1 Tax=unclassified Nonomuraea TaxID=2593643 RepID=UPI0033BFCE94
MTDNSQPPQYGPPQGQGPYYGQPNQYGQQPYQPQQHGQPPYQQQQPPAQYGPPPQYGQQNQYAQPGQYGQPDQYGPHNQYGQQPQFPARIDGKAIKPRLWWIALVWAVAVVLGVVGVVVFAGGVLSSVTDMAPTTTFAAGESVKVAIDPAKRPAVYIATDTRVNYQCEISGGPAQARLVKVSGTQTLSAGGTTWQEILAVNAPAKGDYQLTCATQEESSARFGVGRDVLSAAGGVFGGVAALFLFPGAGLLIGIIGTVVILVRRSGARKRLAVSG